MYIYIYIHTYIHKHPSKSAGKLVWFDSPASYCCIQRLTHSSQLAKIVHKIMFVLIQPYVPCSKHARSMIGPPMLVSPNILGM